MGHDVVLEDLASVYLGIMDTTVGVSFTTSTQPPDLPIGTSQMKSGFICKEDLPAVALCLSTMRSNLIN